MFNFLGRPRGTAALAAASSIAIVASLSSAYAQEQQRTFNIQAQPLSSALLEFSRQSDVMVVADPTVVNGHRAPAIEGAFTPGDALNRLLAGSGLSATLRPEGGYAVQDPNLPTRLGDASGAAPSDDEGATAEILVVGRRTQNTDIRRSEDDVQPYVVFDSAQIENSPAATLTEFLSRQLPANADAIISETGAPSSINLRGLGSNQTLILVDGRRVPGLNLRGDVGQPEITGIPLRAIERIEVLPSTAGGIYGGGATGGVINIILKRDYAGLAIETSYANYFHSDAGQRRLDLTGGFSLDRTQITFTASTMRTNSLTVGDRSDTEASRELLLLNNPNGFGTTPPIGATVNIRSVTGGNLTLDPAFGGASLGSNITHLPFGYLGPTSDNGAALIANAGFYNLAPADDLSDLRRGIAVPKLDAVTLTVRHEFYPFLEGFVDASYLLGGNSRATAGVPNQVTNLPANAPNNPFQQAIRVRFPTPGLVDYEATNSFETLRFSTGVIARLGQGWGLTAEYAWGRSIHEGSSTTPLIDTVGLCVLRTGNAASFDPPGAAQPCSSDPTDARPALNVLQETNTFPTDFTPYLLPSPNDFRGPAETTLQNANIRISGPILTIPGGPISMTASVEGREEFLADVREPSLNSTTGDFDRETFSPSRSQEVISAYLETRIPLVSEQMSVWGIHSLEMQAALRYDHYRTRSERGRGYTVPPEPALVYSTSEGESVDYTLGLRYTPLPGLTLRGSIATGFLPPSVAQIAGTSVDYLNDFPGSLPDFFYSDPLRGGFAGPGVGGEVDSNGDPFPFVEVFGGNPALVPEESESFSVGFVANPNVVPGLRLSVDYTSIEKTNEIVQLGPTELLELGDLLPGRVVRLPLTPDDVALGYTGGVVTFLDWSFVNLSSTRVEAYDFQADYDANTAYGHFHLYAIATWQPSFLRRTTPGATEVNAVGTSGTFQEWRGNIGVDWSDGSWTAGWNAQYYDSYCFFIACTIDANQGASEYDPIVYHDLYATYSFDNRTRIRVGIQNALDERPMLRASAASSSRTQARRYMLAISSEF